MVITPQQFQRFLAMVLLMQCRAVDNLPVRKTSPRQVPPGYTIKLNNHRIARKTAGLAPAPLQANPDFATSCLAATHRSWVMFANMVNSRKIYSGGDSQNSESPISRAGCGMWCGGGCKLANGLAQFGRAIAGKF
jgi:acyl-homoserine lactone acylase PvdQ